MGLKFANFARARVATPPTGTGGLSVTVEAGKGALYPTLAPGDYFYGVFTNAAKSAYEIVKVTGHTGDSFTIDPAGRGIDGTAAQTWLANDLFLVPPTKKMFEDLFSDALLSLVTLVPAANKIAYYTGAATAALTDFTATARALLALAFAAKGDIISAAGAGTAVVTTVGTDGYSLRALASAPGGLAWQPHGLPPGIPLPYLGTTAPAGFVMATGSIGDGSSAATQRANPDTVGLYTVLWNSLADTEAPVSGGRGGSAAADFAAHKTLTLPDYAGRGFVGRDNMSGSATNRVTAAISGIDATKLGAVGGDQRSQQHAHGVTDPGHPHNISNMSAIPDSGSGAPNRYAQTGGVTATDPAATGISIQDSGAGNAQNMTPVVVSNIIITL